MLSKIPCPDCGQEIPVEMELLIQGRGFTCSGCDLTMSLMPQDSALVKESMQGLERMMQGQTANNAG